MRQRERASKGKCILGFAGCVEGRWKFRVSCPIFEISRVQYGRKLVRRHVYLEYEGLPDGRSSGVSASIYD